MSNADTLRERIAWLFAHEMGLQIPSVDTNLFDTGVLDSLAFEQLLLHLDANFGVTTSIHDLKIDHFRSIAHIAEFVAAHASPTSKP